VRERGSFNIPENLNLKSVTVLQNDRSFTQIMVYVVFLITVTLSKHKLVHETGDITLRNVINSHIPLILIQHTARSSPCLPTVPLSMRWCSQNKKKRTIKCTCSRCSHGNRSYTFNSVLIYRRQRTDIGSYLFITPTHAQFYNIITSPLYVFRHSECHPQGVTVLKA
jgi:hypothetical protein